MRKELIANIILCGSEIFPELCERLILEIKKQFNKNIEVNVRN